MREYSQLQQNIMATSFLEKFKGKTQQMGKEGLVGVIEGGSGEGVGNKVVVQTNIQFKPQSVPKQRQNQPKLNNYNRQTYSNINRQKPDKVEKVPYSKNVKVNVSKNQPAVEKVTEERSPFLVMNPFCMDDDEPGEPFNPPAVKKTSEITIQKQRSEASYKQPLKKMTTRGNSTDNRGWSKLGGLGANIGNQEWQEKKKKIDKMQQFAQQVKLSNQQKAKQRKPFEQKESEPKREKNIRQKALEYSKNIPKPPPRRPQKEVQIQQPSPQQPQYNQMEEYERRHKQLQRMLNNGN